MFLADAVAAYVEELTERDFDSPFIALLHRMGFTSIHLVHGGYEFGKDFIGRRTEDGVEVQYCFQTKAGSMGVGAWRDVEKQVHAMRTGSAVHPDFDPTLKRRLVVVITGRLKGGAGVEFQSEREYRISRSEVPPELWDADFLLPRMEEIIVESFGPLVRARTLEILGRIGLGHATRADIGSFARSWVDTQDTGKDIWGQFLTATLLASEAMRAGREDLASQVAFHVIRAVWRSVDRGGKLQPELLQAARQLFEGHASGLWEEVRTLDPLELTTQSTTGIDAFITHPIKSARLIEQLSLLGILKQLQGKQVEAEQIAEYLDAFMSKTPALSHPISDEWAYSLLVGVLFLASSKRKSRVAADLREAAVWLLDWVDAGSGFARAGADPEEEIVALLGQPYGDGAPSPGRYAFAVVADLAQMLDEKDLFADLVNDLEALSTFATLVVPSSTEAGNLVARVEYGLDDLPAAHYAVSAEAIAAGSAGQLFDCLAIWATFRDRHLPSVLEETLSATCQVMTDT